VSGQPSHPHGQGRQGDLGWGNWAKSRGGKFTYQWHLCNKEKHRGGVAGKGNGNNVSWVVGGPVDRPTAMCTVDAESTVAVRGVIHMALKLVFSF